jgi:hypothetical protein
MNSSQADLVRKYFREAVRRRTGQDLPTSMLETTLIRGGSYCGRRFSLHGYSVIWFVDEERIKLFAQDGSLIESMSTAEFCHVEPSVEPVFPIRRAA